MRHYVMTFVISLVASAIAVAAGLGVYHWRTVPTVEGLAGKLLASMNTYLDADEDTRDVDITGGTVMWATGRSFEAQMKAEKGIDEKTVIVFVVYDGESLFWRTDPLAFFFPS